MSSHKLLVANVEFPRYSKSRAFDPRLDDIIRVFRKSQANVATLSECGYNEAMAIASELGGDWEYDRAPGRGRNVPGEGLNCVFRNRKFWKQRSGELWDWNL